MTDIISLLSRNNFIGMSKFYAKAGLFGPTVRRDLANNNGVPSPYVLNSFIETCKWFLYVVKDKESRYYKDCFCGKYIPSLHTVFADKHLGRISSVLEEALERLLEMQKDIPMPTAPYAVDEDIGEPVDPLFLSNSDISSEAVIEEDPVEVENEELQARMKAFLERQEPVARIRQVR